MHPNYTQADLAKMEMEFHRDFENKYDDPIAAFVDHHAVQLGYINPDEAGNINHFCHCLVDPSIIYSMLLWYEIDQLSILNL